MGVTVRGQPPLTAREPATSYQEAADTSSAVICVLVDLRPWLTQGTDISGLLHSTEKALSWCS